MADIEATFRGNVDGGDGLESHLKKQWDFGEAIDKQDKAIAALEHFTGQLMAQNHFDAEGIDGKRRELLQRWLKVKNDLLANCAKFGEAQSQKQFSHDMEIGEQDNVKTPVIDSYKDPPNIQANGQDHKSYETELEEKRDRPQNVIRMGEKYIENQQCVVSEDAVQRHNMKLLEEREHLNTKSTWKHEKLEEINRQRMYTAKDSERYLATEQNLNKKHQLLDEELNAHETRMEHLKKEVDISIGRQTWEENKINDKIQSINDRQKKPLVSFEDHDQNLTAVKNLRNEHKHVESELASHKPDIHVEQTLETEDYGKVMVTVDNLNKKKQLLGSGSQRERVKYLKKQIDVSKDSEVWDENENGIKCKTQSINDRYDKVGELPTDHRSIVDETNNLHHFIRDIDYQEAWIEKQKLLVASEDYCHDLVVVQNLRNVHKYMEADLASRGADIDALQETGAKLQADSNLLTNEIRDRLQGLSKNWKQLKYIATNRNQKLDQSLANLQFAANVEKEAQVTETRHLPSWDKIWNMLVTVLTRLNNLPKMSVYFAMLLSHIAFVYPKEITASYTTSFHCRDGSYALISGANLILEYDYGYSYTQLQSFHLYEVYKGRHMFDYESAAGQAYMKDSYHRLKSYHWTNTGIKLGIPGIKKEMDWGKYEGFIDIGESYEQKSIEIQEISDPPTEMKVFAPGSEERIILNKGFKEHILEALAESYTNITCNSVMVTWVSPAKGNLTSCQAEDERDPTVCPLIIQESELTEDECITLDVYAEQYGVRSENKTYTVCYKTDVPYMPIIIGMAIGICMLVVIVVITVIWLKRSGHNKENGKV